MKAKLQLIILFIFTNIHTLEVHRAPRCDLERFKRSLGSIQDTKTGSSFCTARISLINRFLENCFDHNTQFNALKYCAQYKGPFPSPHALIKLSAKTNSTGPLTFLDPLSRDDISFLKQLPEFRKAQAVKSYFERK